MSLYGLAPATRVADAVLALLAPLTRDEGRYVRTLKRGPGNLDRDTTDLDVLQAMLSLHEANAPAVFVGCDEVRKITLTQGRTNRQTNFWLDVNVYLVDNWQGRVVGRLEPADRTFADPAAKPGLDAFVHDVFCLLAGAGTFAGAGTLRPQRGRMIFNTTDRSIWEWQFQVEVNTTTAPVPLEEITSVVHDIHVETETEGETATVIEQELG